MFNPTSAHQTPPSFPALMCVSCSATPNMRDLEYGRFERMPTLRCDHTDRSPSHRDRSAVSFAPSRPALINGQRSTTPAKGRILTNADWSSSNSYHVRRRSLQADQEHNPVTIENPSADLQDLCRACRHSHLVSAGA